MTTDPANPKTFADVIMARFADKKVEELEYLIVKIDNFGKKITTAQMDLLKYVHNDEDITAILPAYKKNQIRLDTINVIKEVLTQMHSAKIAEGVLTEVTQY